MLQCITAKYEINAFRAYRKIIYITNDTIEIE
jgi:hypothetical protein